MKKIIFFFAILLYANTSKAQFFPGEDVELLRGTKVKFKEISKPLQPYAMLIKIYTKNSMRRN